MNEDKQSVMLADHHAEQWFLHQLKNCVHEEWQVEGIEDLVYTESFGSSYMKCEISCCFCGKTNSIHIPLSSLLELINNDLICNDLLYKHLQSEGEWVDMLRVERKNN